MPQQDAGGKWLIRPSFLSAKLLRDLRELLRYRRKLMHGKVAERIRMLRLLETAH